MDLEGSPGPLHECHLLDCVSNKDVDSQNVNIQTNEVKYTCTCIVEENWFHKIMLGSEYSRYLKSWFTRVSCNVNSFILCTYLPCINNIWRESWLNDNANRWCFYILVRKPNTTVLNSISWRQNCDLICNNLNVNVMEIKPALVSEKSCNCFFILSLKDDIPR